MIEAISSQNPNILGEYYREKIFVQQDKVKGLYGCYSTFEVASEFKEITDPALRAALQRYTGCDEDDPTFRAYESSGIIVAWYWDGDGVLYIEPKGSTPIINDDCKKEYNWEFVS